MPAERVTSFKSMSPYLAENVESLNSSRLLLNYYLMSFV